MRVFAIYNPLVRKRRACAWLKYEPSQDLYEVELAEWATAEDVPLMFSLFIERGERTLPDHWARRWAASRVPPANRHNLPEVLRTHGLDEHYVPTLLANTKGRASGDDFLVEEVPARAYRTTPLAEEPGAPRQLGVQLGRARRAAGMTQRELAEACGVQQAVISRIEHGQGNPTLETLEALARGCGRELRLTLE